MDEIEIMGRSLAEIRSILAWYDSMSVGEKMRANLRDRCTRLFLNGNIWSKITKLGRNVRVRERFSRKGHQSGHICRWTGTKR
jgi:hypothetical protein